jgi:carbamoyl-phosphate synthase/aspartate carbamoyltransferase/dihydroorotase
MDIIDCIATDHAPHTLQEKDSDDPPPGFPGLETALPLMLTTVYEGRLSMDDLLLRMYTNPKRIFNIPDQLETWTEVDLDAEFVISATDSFSRCGWTPFDGWRVRGRVRRVVLHGREAFREGSVMVPSGFGMNLRDMG